jgi:basic amino acid/polyamine antiporter, APA family
MEETHDSHSWVHDYLFVGRAFNPLALIISLGTVLLLLQGVKESKRATNFITALKVALVTFMVIVGLLHCRPSNWIPFFPMGVSGVFRGGMLMSVDHGTERSS